MKNKVLFLLSTHKNTYVSGETLGKELNISRAAISKHIKNLRNEGYQIMSTTNKGYCLLDQVDLLDEDYIRKNVPSFYQIEVHQSVDSTNDVLKQRTNKLEGTVCIANQQLKGRGRNNRSFYSPANEGIYLSILLKPSLSIEDMLKVTALTSVALHKTIQSLYDISCDIKWVNDLYIAEKKIAGILCEGAIELNTNQFEYLVIGIGCNIHAYDKPLELQNIAGSIEDHTTKIVSRNDFIACLLCTFYEYYNKIEDNTFLKTYREHSNILKKDIIVHSHRESYEAKAIDIDDNANLIVERNGKKEILSAGEISIRKK